MAALLIGEDFSPWTEKARWALDHHGVGYDFHQYQPLLEEPWLRLKTRNLTRRATVPALIDNGEVVPDSYAIARYAERRGRAESLFPDRHVQEIERFNVESDRALRAGRALFFERLLNDRAAQLDNAPTFVPKALRPLLRPAVRGGVLYLRAKHGAAAESRTDLESVLAELRRALANASYVLGEFSYADVAMAVVLQFVSPVDDRYIQLTPANRACWTEPSLAEEYADLVRWRDELYARHRRLELGVSPREVS